MYEFMGKASPFLVLAFLALLDGGEEPGGSIQPKKQSPWQTQTLQSREGSHRARVKAEADECSTGASTSTGYSVIAKSHVSYYQMHDIAVQEELVPHYLINPLIALMA